MTTKVTDVVVPEIFTPYTQTLTAQKARLVQAGILTPSPILDKLLAGGGRTFTIPSFNDLDAADGTGGMNENVSNDNDNSIAPLDKIGTYKEIAVRLVRNKAWSAMSLARELAGADPMSAIADRVAFYWTRRLQSIFIHTWKGIIADNENNDNGDMIVDISEETNHRFNGSAFIDAATTMGDSADLITTVVVHSVVFAQMQKNNLIEYIPESEGRIRIPTYLGREVIVDDGLPYNNETKVCETWLFGAGACQLGEATTDNATEVFREPLAGNGGGQEILITRRVYCVHPTGFAFVGTGIGDGGPTNAQLANASSWDRVYERKLVKFAVLRTKEAD